MCGSVQRLIIIGSAKEELQIKGLSCQSSAVSIQHCPYSDSELFPQATPERGLEEGGTGGGGGVSRFYAFTRWS